MPRFANLPLAARLGAAFGLLAAALIAVAAISVNVFSTFDDDVDQLAQHNVRAVQLAGELGRHAQEIGRLTADASAPAQLARERKAADDVRRLQRDLERASTA